MMEFTDREKQLITTGLYMIECAGDELHYELESDLGGIPDSGEARDLMNKIKETKSNKKTYIWVVNGKSESCDEYGPKVYHKKPTDKQLSALAHGWDGDDDKEGDGYDGSYVYIEVEKVEIE